MEDERTTPGRQPRASESGGSSSGTGLTQDELVAGYLRGSHAAFTEVESWIRAALRRHYPGLATEHEDLAQSVHGKLFASLTDGRFAKGAVLRSYVVGVVHHTAIDRLREIYRVRVLSEALLAEPTPPWQDPYRRAEPAADAQLLHQALLATPPRCREMWRLLLNERLSYEEIGQRLALPPGTVKSRMWHCRRKALAALRRLRLVHRTAAARGGGGRSH